MKLSKGRRIQINYFIFSLDNNKENIVKTSIIIFEVFLGKKGQFSEVKNLEIVNRERISNCLYCKIIHWYSVYMIYNIHNF